MTPEEARLVMKGWLDNQSQLAFLVRSLASVLSYRARWLS